MILCMDYKLRAKKQTIRINEYLSRIMAADQRGFMKDFCIDLNILELQHLIDYGNENNVAGLLMCIGFVKKLILLNGNFYLKP